MSSATNASTSTNTVSSLDVSTRFIFQQRIILIIFLGIIGALIGWQTADNSNNNNLVQKFSLTPIPDVVAEFDFAIAEAAWSNLQTDTEGNLKINAQLESALVEAIDVMQGQTSKPQIERMALLLEKQFGTTASQQFIALLPVLKNYKEAEQRWLEKNSSNQSIDKPLVYAELFQLQDELLGEALAGEMFAEQRRLAIMMSASLKIRNDTTLSETEKKQALIDLQTRFQNDSQESAPKNIKNNLRESAPSE